ncbi:MAG: ABC transporter substrate-binding protein [Pseudomonadota bacterium]
MKKFYCLLMLLVLAGCAEESVQPLVFGAVTWPGYEPAYLARDLGFLDERQVHLAEFTNTTEVVRAMRDGRLHVAGLTLDEALSLRQSIPDLQVFMAVDVSNGADVLMVRRGINSLGQLKGKRIGVEKTALGAYFLTLILRAAKLAGKDVHIVSLPLDEQVQAYRSGSLDAVVTFGPVREELSRLGAVVLFDSTKVPGKIVDTLVVRASDAAKYSEQLHILAEAWFRAVRVIQNDPALAYPLLAQREHVQPAQIGRTMRGLVLLDKRNNLLQLSGAPAPLLNTARDIQLILEQSELPSGSGDLSTLINPRIVAEAGLE